MKNPTDPTDPQTSPGGSIGGSLNAAQREAIAARGNVLVVAGAGTGKTTTLVERCLALLNAGMSLESILLVTFTEAAALELRLRLREALATTLDHLTTDRQNSEPVGGFLLNRREHFEKQLALLDAAFIGTLHSFCLRLVRDHFQDLDIDPQAAVLDETQTVPLIRQTLDRLFEQAYADAGPEGAAVRDLVRRYGRGSDPPIRRLIVQIHRYCQSLPNPEAWLATQRELFAATDPACWTEWMCEAVREWRASSVPVLESQPEGPLVVSCRNALSRSVPPIRREEADLALREVWTIIEDESLWPKGSKTSLRAQLKPFLDSTEFLSALVRTPEADPLSQDWEWVRGPMTTLLRLTEMFACSFLQAKRELGGLDFSDLEQCALRLLRSPSSGEPSVLANEWRQRLDCVFVDEYQDINAAQDSILAALSRPDPDGDRFLVGDVKQSIYRFRLADPSIFRRYEAQWSQGTANSRRISLVENFRSQPEIIECVNRFFGAVMRPAIGGVSYEELVAGGDKLSSNLPGNDLSASVELHLVTRGGETDEDDGTNGGESDAKVPDLLEIEREARLVALRLRELCECGKPIWDRERRCRRPVEWRDMAVLMRSPGDRVEAFAQEFARAGVPLAAARGGFFRSAEISDLLSLLRLLDNPLQDLPLLAVLRSPLVGLTLDELAQIRMFDRAGQFWNVLQRFASARSDENSGGLPWPKEERLATARKVNDFLRQFEDWRQAIRETPLSRCLETALAETHYESLLRAEPRGEQRVANVRRLLDLARRYDPWQRQGLYRFLGFIAAQEEMEVDLESAPDAAANAVKMMSVHQSKGLEFPVVVVAGLGVRFNERNLRAEILIDAHYGLCPRVISPDGAARYPSLPYWLARERERRELLGEELRLLYVAMTRAREKLLLTGTGRIKDDGQTAVSSVVSLTEAEIIRARCALDWLLPWLAKVEGSGCLASNAVARNLPIEWRIYPETEEAWQRIPEPTPAAATPTAESIGAAEVEAVRRRLVWRYPSVAATAEPGKSTVSALRQRADAGRDEEARPWLFGSVEAGRGVAAEAGIAFHSFLERVDVSKAANLAQLRDEAVRLRTDGTLSVDQETMIDLEAILAFWTSNLGAKIREHVPRVRRELPFTARFSVLDLRKLELPVRSGLTEDEFVVVQGVADLVVLLADQIWLVDYKTDTVNASGLTERVAEYTPQLRLYSLALSRIYGRPVTEAALHFLRLRQTVFVPP